LDSVGVDQELVLKAHAKSILKPKSTVNPYLRAFVGGITTDQGLNKEGLTNLYTAAQTDNLTATRELEVQSGWGKHWKNAETKKDELIPGLEDDERDKIKATEDVILAALKKAAIDTVSIVDNTEKYPVGTVELNEEKLDITVNGEKIENFAIINLYFCVLNRGVPFLDAKKRA
jgi:hypothetical protein